MNRTKLLLVAALALLAGPALAADAWIDSATSPDSSPTQDPVAAGRALEARVATGQARAAASADPWTVSVTSPDSSPTQALQAPSLVTAVAAYDRTHAVEADLWISSAMSPDSSPTQDAIAIHR